MGGGFKLVSKNVGRGFPAGGNIGCQRPSTQPRKGTGSPPSSQSEAPVRWPGTVRCPSVRWRGKNSTSPAPGASGGRACQTARRSRLPGGWGYSITFTLSGQVAKSHGVNTLGNGRKSNRNPKNKIHRSRKLQGANFKKPAGAARGAADKRMRRPGNQEPRAKSSDELEGRVELRRATVAVPSLRLGRYVPPADAGRRGLRSAPALPPTTSGCTGGGMRWRNEVANWPQTVELGARWFDVGVFHPRRLAGLHFTPTLFDDFHGMPVI